MIGSDNFVRSVLFGILILYGYICIDATLSVYPDYGRVLYYNPRYLKWANASIKRYGRKSDSFLNIMFELIETVGDNVTARIEFYEFLHNEYRRSFVEMEWKLCYLIQKDQVIGPIIRGYGIPCPITPGVYKIVNTSIAPRIMDVFPFEKCRLEFSFINNHNRENIAKAELYATLKNTDKKKNNLANATASSKKYV